MSIPPILHNDKLIFDDIDRTNLFNIYFSKQSEIDDSNSNTCIPNLSHVTNQISEIKLCENEVKDILKVSDFFLLNRYYIYLWRSLLSL
jgi:hypothetical protein